MPKSITFLGKFCKGGKIFIFSRKLIFGQLLQTFGDFFLVTLVGREWLYKKIRHFVNPPQKDLISQRKTR